MITKKERKELKPGSLIYLVDWNHVDIRAYIECAVITKIDRKGTWYQVKQQINYYDNSSLKNPHGSNCELLISKSWEGLWRRCFLSLEDARASLNRSIKDFQFEVNKDILRLLRNLEVGQKIQKN